MKTMQAIHFKNKISGLRCFADAETAVHCGEDPATLHAVAGILVKWPAILGSPPSDADIAAWEAEYDQTVAVEEKRLAAEKAVKEAALEAALNDPNAPQAVKDYKAAKK